MKLRLVSWNINSIRSRLELLDAFLRRFRPHVVCLQEIKCMDAGFPLKAVREMGYPHIALHGQKAYHGVAILSRLPFAEDWRLLFCGKQDARHIAVRFDGGAAPWELHNFYVPAGGDVPDAFINDKFAHKLDFLDEMTAWSGALSAKGRRLLVGDLNIAPLPQDVWNHKALLNVVSHTPQETKKLNRLQSSHGWLDVVRHFNPPPQSLYSWWSYRAVDWSLSDRGRRLDHIWASPALRSRLRSSQVAREVRGWERPSDHAPVLAELDL